MNYTRITQMLKDGGVSVTAAKDGIWSTSFDVNGSARAVMLIHREGGDYFYIFSILTAKAPPIKLDDVPAEVLRAVIRLETKTILAKVNYIESPEVGFFAAVSECSVEKVSGKKLARRLEACARLAAELEQLLATIPFAGASSL